MDFREYAERIKFTNIQPQDPIHLSEVGNTEINQGINAGMVDLCAMPKMSTFALGCLINKAVGDMSADQCFVNVGVWHGFTLLAGMLGNPGKRCIGVDNFSEFGGPRLEFRQRYLGAKSDKHLFFEMDYRIYFANFHKPEDKIGFYIYDGAHDYQNQLEGLQISEPFLADGALVMVDDTNWPDPRQATLDFMEKSTNQYELIFDRRTACNMHPTWWNGIMILQKKGVK